MHEERLPGTWSVGDLCRDAFAKAQRYSGGSGDGGGAPVEAASGNPA